MRRFEFIDSDSNKFWEITLSDKTFTVTFGKIGTNGQSQEKSFSTSQQAKEAYEKLIAEKVKKGYVEIQSFAPPAATTKQNVSEDKQPDTVPADLAGEIGKLVKARYSECIGVKSDAITHGPFELRWALDRDLMHVVSGPKEKCAELIKQACKLGAKSDKWAVKDSLNVQFWTAKAKSSGEISYFDEDYEETISVRQLAAHVVHEFVRAAENEVSDDDSEYGDEVDFDDDDDDEIVGDGTFESWLNERDDEEVDLESEALKRIKLDPKVAGIIEEAEGEIVGVSKFGFLVEISAINLDKIAPKVAAHGYGAYSCDLTGELPNAVLKVSEPYEFLVMRGFHGAGLGAWQMIRKLKHWEKIAEFRISGAGEDWIELRFTRLPEDLRAFAEEAHQFCRDDTETDEIYGGLKDDKYLYLWWD